MADSIVLSRSSSPTASTSPFKSSFQSNTSSSSSSSSSSSPSPSSTSKTYLLTSSSSSSSSSASHFSHNLNHHLNHHHHHHHHHHHNHHSFSKSHLSPSPPPSPPSKASNLLSQTPPPPSTPTLSLSSSLATTTTATSNRTDNLDEQSHPSLFSNSTAFSVSSRSTDSKRPNEEEKEDETLVVGMDKHSSSPSHSPTMATESRPVSPSQDPQASQPLISSQANELIGQKELRSPSSPSSNQGLPIESDSFDCTQTCAGSKRKIDSERYSGADKNARFAHDSAGNNLVIDPDKCLAQDSSLDKCQSPDNYRSKDSGHDKPGEEDIEQGIDQCTSGHHKDDEAALVCVKEDKQAAKNLDQAAIEDSSSTLADHQNEAAINQAELNSINNSTSQTAAIDEDEDDLMNNFDPAEVLKRMKVELKEEFDDDHITKDDSVHRLIDSCDTGGHKDVGFKDYFNYLGGGGVGGGNLDFDYFRKILTGNFPIENGELQNHSSNNSVAMLTAAAAAAAAAVATSAAFSTTNNDDSFLDEDKKRLFQAFLLKQLNNIGFAGDQPQQCNNGESPFSMASLGSSAGLSNPMASISSSSSSSLSVAQNMSPFGNGSVCSGGSSFMFPFNTSGNCPEQKAVPSGQKLSSNDGADQRYCTSCNIQFMSSKTYKVHKELYCSSRHQTSKPNQTFASSSATTQSSSAAATPPTSVHSTVAVSPNTSNNSMTYGTCSGIATANSINVNKSSCSSSSQTSSGFVSSPPPTLSSGSGSPNSSTNSTTTRKRSSTATAAATTNSANNRHTASTTGDQITIEDSLKNFVNPDFSSFFTNLNVNGSNSNDSSSNPFNCVPPLVNSNQFASKSTTSGPIYIVISTNPLVLLPFMFNSATNSMEPVSNASSAINLGSTSSNNNSNSNATCSQFDSASLLNKSIAPLPSTPIVFPNGLPQMFDNRPTTSAVSNQQSQPLLTSATLSPTSSPFVTTLSNLRQQLNMLNSAAVSPSLSSTSSNIAQLQQQHAFGILNTIMNTELSCKEPNSSQEFGKKRRLSETECDQPLDLSSASQTVSMSRSKRSKENNSDLAKNHCESINSEDSAIKNASFQEHIANLLQKISTLQSNNTELANFANFLYPGAASSNADEISPMVRDNPAFAQYMAMAMAALTNSNLPSVSNFASSLSSSSPAVSQTSPQVDVLVKQGNSICSECNIVFYRHENYIVHKKMYCASRRSTDTNKTQSASPNERLPSHNANSINRPKSASSSSSPVSFNLQSKYSQNLTVPDASCSPAKSTLAVDENVLTLSNSPSLACSRDATSVSPALVMSPNSKQSAVFQYYCAACGIKFTSYDNLNAHQTYYCLKRTGNAAVSNGTVPASVSPVNPNSLSPSPVSMGATNQNLLTPQLLATAAAGLSAQANQDSLLDFTTNNALSQHWALVAAATAAVAGAKNHLNANTLGEFNCQKCKATYVSQETLAAHVCSADLRLEKTEKSSSAPSNSSMQTYKCTICGYKGHTMRGMRTHVRVHSEELSSSGAFEENFIVQNTDLPEPSVGRRGNNHGNSLTNLARQRRRSSNVDAAFLSTQNASATETLDSVIRNTVNSYLESAVRRNKELMEERNQKGSILNESLSTQNHTCQFCPYTSNYKGNVIRHIKLVHKDVHGAGALASFASPTSGKDSIDVDRDGDDIASLKSEDGSSRGTRSPSKLVNGGTGDTASNVSRSPTPRDSSNTVAPDTEIDSTNYCNSCNISFTYRNSYLAHKKYYCSSHTNEA